MPFRCYCCCCSSLMVLAAMLVGSEGAWLTLLLLVFRASSQAEMSACSPKLMLSGDFLTCVFLGSFLEVGIFLYSCPGGSGLPFPSQDAWALWGTEHLQSSLCHRPEVWHFLQSLKVISNLGAAGYESMQVGVSQPSSPSLFLFLSCFYLPEKQNSRFLDSVTPSGDPLSGFLVGHLPLVLDMTMERLLSQSSS